MKGFAEMRQSAQRFFHTSARMMPKRNARRVAFIYEGVAYGGTEEYILLMLRYLDTRRYAPIVVTSGYNYRFCPPQFVARVQELGVPLISTDDRHASRFGSAVHDIANLARVFRATETDVVHIHHQRPEGGRRATIAARLAGVPGVVRSEHLPPSSNLRRFMPLLSKPQDWLTDYVIAGSDACLREQLELLHRDPKKTFRIFYGIELERFSPHHDVAAAKQKLGLDPHIPTIGKVARLSPEKGHIYAIDAAARVIREAGPVNMLLVGDGPLEAELRARAAELGIQDHVHFLGFAHDTVPLIQAMDIAVMSSISEGISLAMLEYMAMGKPIVSTDEPSFRETVVHDESAVIVPAQDANALAKGMLRLLRNPGQAHRLAMGALKRVHAEFDIQSNVEQFMNLYDRLSGGTDRRTNHTSLALFCISVGLQIQQLELDVAGLAAALLC
jgi:glycosyltransferase involved in cell wall biosynthesis